MSRVSWFLALATGMLSVSAAAQAPGPQSPTEVIRQEYDALNQHDIGRVFALYSDSIKYGELRDSALIAPSSKAALRASVEPFLAKNPRGKVTVVHQIALGRFVIADQRMTGTSDGTPFELLDVSEVRGGRVVAEIESADIAATPRVESRQADAVVKQMNDAFGGGDAAGAVSRFADPVLFHVWGEDSVRHMSTGRVRQGFRDLMTANPHMHYVIADRMVAGRFVVQHERLTGMADGKQLDAWAILEVRFGRVIAEWECPWAGSTEAAN